MAWNTAEDSQMEQVNTKRPVRYCGAVRVESIVCSLSEATGYHFNTSTMLTLTIVTLELLSCIKKADAGTKTTLLVIYQFTEKCTMQSLNL